tara:strand:- start:549 stop:851 length:303 start_codon:yes stop_codon:yes gene_type:complete
MNDYAKGFRDGWFSAYEEMGYDYRSMGERGFLPQTSEGLLIKETRKPKRKVKQSKKQKLLTQMTKKKWDKYKKGRGKKTYVEIRAEVSRSQAFKKAAKRL